MSWVDVVCDYLEKAGMATIYASLDPQGTSNRYTRSYVIKLQGDSSDSLLADLSWTYIRDSPPKRYGLLSSPQVRLVGIKDYRQKQPGWGSYSHFY